MKKALVCQSNFDLKMWGCGVDDGERASSALILQYSHRGHGDRPRFKAIPSDFHQPASGEHNLPAISYIHCRCVAHRLASPHPHIPG
jgi:hypothetical protein